MLMAVSGTQGAGKTSLLNCLKQRGYNVLNHKTARDVLNDWKMDLQTIYSDPELICQFQTKLVKRKYEDESKFMHSDDLWFTERTYLDLFTYAVTHLGNKNTYSAWLGDYYNTCMEYQSQISCVYFIRGNKFQVEHDGIRPSNPFYATMVDLMLNHTLTTSGVDVKTIDFEGIEQRADFITFTIDHDNSPMLGIRYEPI